MDTILPMVLGWHLGPLQEHVGASITKGTM